MTPPEPIPTDGEKVGRYQLLREVARGPFGPLMELRACDDQNELSGLGRIVTLSSALAPDAERIISDAAWDTLELRHDLLLSVADVVFGGGWVTLVHDHAEGSVLTSLLKRAQERQSAFPLGVVLRIALDLIDSFEQTRLACVAAQIAYRPGGSSLASLYLCGDGRTRPLDAQFNASLLASGAMRAIATSPLYPPPEVVTGDGDVSQSADVFAVGVTLWALLSGKELHESLPATPRDGNRAMAQRIGPSLPKGATVPAALLETVTCAIDPSPRNRPQTLLELRRLLAAIGQASSYEKVIDFTDALLHRESTLFRLTLDPTPRLSDEVRVDRPKGTHLSWAVELAKQARATASAEGPESAPATAAPATSVPVTRSRSETERAATVLSESSGNAPKPIAILPTAIFTPSGPPPKLSGAPRKAQGGAGAQSNNARKTLVGLQAPRTSLKPQVPAAVAPAVEAAPAPISEPPPTAKVPTAKLTEIVGRAEALIQDVAPPIVRTSEGSLPLTNWSPQGPSAAAASSTPVTQVPHRGMSWWKVALLVAASNLVTSGVTFALSRRSSSTDGKPMANRGAALVTPNLPARQAPAPMPSGSATAAADSSARSPEPSATSQAASSALPPPPPRAKPVAQAPVTQAPVPAKPVPGKRKKKKYTPREL